MQEVPITKFSIGSLMKSEISLFQRKIFIEPAKFSGLVRQYINLDEISKVTQQNMTVEIHKKSGEKITLSSFPNDTQSESFVHLFNFLQSQSNLITTPQQQQSNSIHINPSNQTIALKIIHVIDSTHNRYEPKYFMANVYQFQIFSQIQEHQERRFQLPFNMVTKVEIKNAPYTLRLVCMNDQVIDIMTTEYQHILNLIANYQIPVITDPLSGTWCSLYSPITSSTSSVSGSMTSTLDNQNPYLSLSSQLSNTQQTSPNTAPPQYNTNIYNSNNQPRYGNTTTNVNMNTNITSKNINNTNLHTNIVSAPTYNAIHTTNTTNQYTNYNHPYPSQTTQKDDYVKIKYTDIDGYYKQNIPQTQQQQQNLPNQISQTQPSQQQTQYNNYPQLFNFDNNHSENIPRYELKDILNNNSASPHMTDSHNHNNNQNNMSASSHI